MTRRFLIGLMAVSIGCSSGGGGPTPGTGGNGNAGTNGTAGTGAGGTSTGGTTGAGGVSSGGSGGSAPAGSGGSAPAGSGGSATGAGGTGGGTAGSGSGGSTAGSGGSTARGGTGGSSTAGSGGSTARGGSGGGTAGTTGTGGQPPAGSQNVLERNKNPSRDGHFLQPSLTKTAAATMAADTVFNTAATFTGNVGASPVYLEGASGSAGAFFIPTTGNDLVARNENGSMKWTRNIGAPATASIGCSSFATAAPLGMLATPAIDATTRTVYVAGAIGGGSGVTGQIASAINADDGTVKSGWPVNVSTALSFDPKLHNQRSALSLVNGILYVPYAGYVGDCGAYRGRVVAISTSSPTTTGMWSTGGQGEGIWMPGGLASDGNGVIAVTGNRTPSSATSMPHADSEEVVRITGMGTKADYYYPTNWQDMDSSDADFGSVNAVVVNVPGATPSSVVVAIAKDGKGYVLNAGMLRGSTSSTAAGGHISTFTLASGAMAIHSVPAAYRTSQGTYVVVSTTSGSTGCPAGGTGSGGRRVMAVRIGTNLSATIAWCAEMASVTTGPIATTTDGTADAIVWYTSGGQLRGVDGDTGTAIYMGTTACSGIQKWTSPIAVKGRIVAAGNGRLCAWGIPGSLTQ